jgi:hypothetical protein
MDRMDSNQELVNRYLNDAEFKSVLFKLMTRRLYDDIRRESYLPPPSSR